MPRRRIYVVETPSKRSFNIALFTGCILFAGVLTLFIGMFPFSWDFIGILIGMALFGFILAWVVKKIEKTEENW